MPHLTKLFQHVRWSSALVQALSLSVITFCVVLPLCCHQLLYSYFFIRSFYLDSVSEKVLEENFKHGQDALLFWQSKNATALHAFANVSHRPQLLVVVISVRRSNGQDFHYLLQVMQRLSSLVGACGARPCAEVLVCDVESGPLENKDVRLLQPHFQVIRRSQQNAHKPVNMFEKEKRDYVFCIRKAWSIAKPQHVLVLEDDALPRADFFPVINNLLSRGFASDTLYIKLYHPERLQRYWNPEPYRLLEWVGIGWVGATILLLLGRFWNPWSFTFTFSGLHFLFLTLYVMGVVELLGRHYLLEARRLSPQLYAVSPATECCTPAMLFPGTASLRAARYLDASFCVKGYAKDMVLYKMARTIPGERSHSIEPNLVAHIGSYSSVRPNPSRPKVL
ncbi:post-GPI attachment to proteins factor 4 [Gouania willdenowi]|uniref:Transmembrane protein 246 n=1 Tax=Gouania willdenowi TaxID=441366 RepID=A0A8C5H3M9_GOUWI|nr:transmembrane protein 246 [Gouania willdenowi]XP_028328796.1 transmembrane protein 246 [Gouania willdenowi]